MKQRVHSRLRVLTILVKTRPSAIDPLATTDKPGEAFELAWRASLKRRILFVFCALALWVAGIEARLVNLQVFQHEALFARAEKQQRDVLPVSAKRGEIVDRNGQILAYSVDADTVVAYPSEVKDPAAAARAVCEAFGDCTPADQAALAEKLSRKSAYAVVRRAVSPDQAQQVARLKIGGIALIAETKRYYPKRELAAHVLGFVGTDNVGLGGIEAVYDKVIRGREGRVALQIDARRHTMDSRVERAPTAGATVELTIDQYIQHIAERELQAGVEANRARGGTAIVMDPRTGEILALASYPTFNPNAFQYFSDDERRNRAIQDVYEPGSTFKIVTASAALEEGVFQIDDIINTSPGVISFPGRKPIKEAEGHDYGQLSMMDVIVRSSNIGAIKIGLQVGADRLSRYVRRFGFGEALGADMRGESAGIVFNPAQINESTLASMSMGYNISVTPLQMIAAASAVANGGMLYEPHLVRAVTTGDRREAIAPKALRRSINQETAAIVTTIMEGVVQNEHGTGKQAALDRYQVAGKTGTAAKIIDRHYSESDYNASFVGFVPSRAPALAIVVVIDTPRAGNTYGGLVAAPVFRRIADAALRQMAVTPTINPTPVIVAQAEAPAPARTPRPAEIVPVVSALGGPPAMPDVRGLSAREALHILSNAGLQVKVSGSGDVADQTPAAGAPIARGGWSTLQLDRRPPPKPVTPPGGGGV